MSARASALTLDHYHLDSAYVSWRARRNEVATFDLYARTHPFAGRFLLVAGLADALDFVTSFTFGKGDLAYLRKTTAYEPEFLDVLAKHRFTGEIAAMPEGTVAFAGEPLLRVTAPFREALLLESGLLQIVNVSTLVATKAARVVLAARGTPVADFGLRRSHAPSIATRAAWIGGVASTSFVDAGKRFGIPTTGTIPHALVQAFEDETEAFDEIARALPAFTLLLDTYGVERAAKRAVDAAFNAPEGHRLVAVRLDSGDVGEQARTVRAVLDDAGLRDVRILVSGDLDEYAIDALLAQRAPVDGFGVGTRLGAGLGSVEHAAPGGALSVVYKLAAIGDRPVIKTAAGKETWPGRKQVVRIGRFERDVITLDVEPPPDRGRPLLETVVTGGRAHDLPTLEDARARAASELASLPERHRGIRGAEAYPVDLSHALQRLREVASASS